MTNKKENRGGKRDGAGPPKLIYPYERIVMHKTVPEKLVKHIRSLIDKEIEKFEEDNGFVVKRIKNKKQ